MPRPVRLGGGHRRYSERDVTLVEEIVRHRSAGVGLEGAIARAVSRSSAADVSVFAGLRRQYPELQPRVLRKRTLLALSRAIEDECCARAERPLLFAGFQRAEFYASSRRRWAELARTAAWVAVFAEADGTGAGWSAGRDRVGGRPGAGPGLGPARIRLPPSAPLRREWVVVCDAPDHPACLAGWEVPAAGAGPDLDRRFETVWSADPRVVRSAARICAALAEWRGIRPGAARARGPGGRRRPPARPAGAGGRAPGRRPGCGLARPAAGGAVLDRMLAYLDGS